MSHFLAQQPTNKNNVNNIITFSTANTNTPSPISATFNPSSSSTTANSTLYSPSKPIPISPNTRMWGINDTTASTSTAIETNVSIVQQQQHEQQNNISNSLDDENSPTIDWSLVKQPLVHTSHATNTDASNTNPPSLTDRDGMTRRMVTRSRSKSEIPNQRHRFIHQGRTTSNSTTSTDSESDGRVGSLKRNRQEDAVGMSGMSGMSSSSSSSSSTRNGSGNSSSNDSGGKVQLMSPVRNNLDRHGREIDVASSRDSGGSDGWGWFVDGTPPSPHVQHNKAVKKQQNIQDPLLQHVTKARRLRKEMSSSTGTDSGRNRDGQRPRPSSKSPVTRNELLLLSTSDANAKLKIKTRTRTRTTSKSND